MIPTRPILAALLAGLSLVPAGAPAQQALERNPPPQAPAKPVSLRVRPVDHGMADPTPLGVDLAGIYLIGAKDAVARAAPGGIGGPADRLDPAAMRKALRPFLGKPLSLALAGRIQAAIARVYREAGYPFVSVTLPPQEITRGVLQLRVIEFRAGKVRIEGVPAQEARRIRTRLRVAPGQRLDARAIEEDLDWLNRAPYRRAEGTFRPGEATALSDLDIAIATGRPWQFFAGWSNASSAATGRERFFLGATAALPWLDGGWLSYQATASGDIWGDPGKLLPQKGRFPSYLSHAARLTIPTFARQSLEIAPSFVATRTEPNAFFAFENTTYELPIIYRSAISNVLPGRYWGDLYGGVEFKHLARSTFFSGTQVAGANANLAQLVLGWSGRFSDRRGQTALDLRVKADPGGVLPGNDAATWQVFSNNRVRDVRYAYLAFDIGRTTRLPAALSWQSSVSGILSGKPLPDSERLSLGGRYAVRGYNYDDVSVDSGLVWRNELRFRDISLPGGPGGSGSPKGTFSPYVFADVGIGLDRATKVDATLGSIGAGFDYNAGRALTANAFAGLALANGGSTKAGNWKLQLSISAHF